MVVVATEALGMGCNINDVEVVLILGVKNLTFASLKQREGRAGRNPGLQSNSILIAEPWTINCLPPVLSTMTSIPSSQNTETLETMSSNTAMIPTTTPSQPSRKRKALTEINATITSSSGAK
ncbi:hypothetical protein RUND412_010763 [Rhizina undulata]